MQEAAAQKLARETLQGSFNKERFVSLIKNILNHVEEAPFTYKGNFIFDDFADSIKLVERIGKYKDPDEKLIDILVVHLQKETSLERARTKQRNFVAKYLKGSRGGVLRDAALVAFVSPGGDDWRFSLVKMEYKFNEKGKVKEEFTPARRYSFLVGKNENSHTAQSRLLPILLDDEVNPTLKELEEVFSVERVTKEFFEKYRDLFLQLKESLDDVVKKNSKVKADFEKKSVDTADFAKKLLGQIVFLYFLQKKGWFGVKRGGEWGSGSKHFLRELFEKKHGDYKNFFNDILEPLFYEALRLERSGDYYSRFDCRIPFLNGGLFDPLGDYDWWKTDILLPDAIFSNDRKTKEGDTGNGILDIFDRYNFTVKEDEPLEKEVAVDPEMLGKVFENLLEVKDRKSKGTYYTPREIVHYMCQESLANYLAAELSSVIASEARNLKEDIETLIRYGEFVVEHDSHVVNAGRETKDYSFKLPESVRKHAKLIDEKLASIRVCDPAVGSGAFVVGMMNEIIRTRNALTPYISSPRHSERSEESRSPYHFKHQAIQNCLYGVDIDPGAVEIAKLRLWLSLVVDEEEREKIQPLPNLDYKIVQGNSLLGGVEDNLFSRQLFNQLEELKPLYFNETSASKKQAYKKQIDELISQITNGHKDFDFEVYFSEVFHEKKGFDVVIANPPYGVLEDVAKDHGQKHFLERIRKMTTEYIYSLGGKLNLYRLFIERGFRIVKKAGIQTYIVPSTILADKNTAGLRRMFSSEGAMNFFIEIPEKTQVFENVTQAVAIFSVQKTQRDGRFFLSVNLKSRELPPENIVEAEWKGIESISGPDLSIPLISHPSEYLLLKKVHLDMIPLGKFTKIAQGDVNLTVHKKYIVDKPTDYLLVRGEHISHFRVDLSDENKERRWIDYEKMKKELNTKKVSIISDDSSRQRIVCQNVANMGLKFRIIPALIPPSVLVGHSAEFIYPLTTEWDIKAVLGILASRLLNWRFKKTSTNNHVNIYELENLPFPKLSSVEQKPIVTLVDKILAITKDDDYLESSAKQAKVREYEKQIDQLVYKLYGLTPEEIAIVEGNTTKSSPPTAV